ncbi:MAG: amidase [Actinobacteria bacterium]|nr:amidase [Actinomycetota bacterium]
MDAEDLLFAGAAEQARMIREGAVSARALTEATLDRIARIDPQLNAFRVVLREQALAEADAVDGGHAKGLPLAGVPIAVKDDVDVSGEVTAWGSLAHGGPRPHDDPAVARLRAAGAVIVGKTSVPELTIWPWAESLAFGAARNPWSLDHTPGGSSGGSGAAAAAGLCGVALGSDGLGSVRIPAAFNGLFGIKPQRDRIPTRLDPWNGLSVVGPLARTVADAALFLDATADGLPEGGFSAALAAPPTPLRIALAVNVPPPLVGVRLGAEQRRALEATAVLLRELGHTVVEHDIDYPAAAFPSIVARYLRSIHDCAAGMTYPERLERRTKGMARLGGLISDARLGWACAMEPTIAEHVNRVFDSADVVLFPGPSGPPFRVGELQGRGVAWTLNAAALRVPWYGVWNAIGQPATSVPAGFDADGLPLAAQFAGKPGDELTLLRLAAQLEAIRPWSQHRPGGLE